MCQYCLPCSSDYTDCPREGELFFSAEPVISGHRGVSGVLSHHRSGRQALSSADKVGPRASACGPITPVIARRMRPPPSLWPGAAAAAARGHGGGNFSERHKKSQGDCRGDTRQSPADGAGAEAVPQFGRLCRLPPHREHRLKEVDGCKAQKAILTPTFTLHGVDT